MNAVLFSGDTVASMIPPNFEIKTIAEHATFIRSSFFVIYIEL